ncbi:hypothetical protein I3760_03G098300 [Carya illinoinensis]|nr:hypothetical protein I3760_03G098300 [Carya illinoinensis]
MQADSWDARIRLLRSGQAAPANDRSPSPSRTPTWSPAVDEARTQHQRSICRKKIMSNFHQQFTFDLSEKRCRCCVAGRGGRRYRGWSNKIVGAILGWDVQWIPIYENLL